MKTMKYAALILLASIGGAALGASYSVVKEESVIGVVVRKAGPLSAMAHNHFIYAGDYEVVEAFDPESASGVVVFNHQDLINDEHSTTMRYSADIQSRGIVNEEFAELSQDDRNTIRGHMLAGDQLGQGEITVKFVGFTGEKANIEMTVKGVSVVKEVEAVFEQDESTASLSVTGPFLFSDFGIKPYSAFGGLLRNKDEFYVYGRFYLKAN